MTREEDYMEEVEEDNYNYQSSTPDLKDGEAVMSSFFALAQKLKKFELKWKGRTLIDGKEVLTHTPVGSDRFVDALITSIESIVSQDNSISTTTEEKANVILWEKYDSFTKACIKGKFKGEFNEDSFILLKEEYDHIIELFMGHVINSHGIDSAYKLQGGVIADKQTNATPLNMLELGKDLLTNKR